MRELNVIQPRHAPVRILMLYLTEDCNLRCTYCFVKKTPRAMSTSTARRSADYFLQPSISGAGRRLSLTFFGGEPFLALSVMSDVLGYASAQADQNNKPLRFAATTNGTLATPEVERLIRTHQIELLVSIDGGEEANLSRPYVQGGSSYRTVARNLKRLVRWSPSVIARATYHPEALDLLKNAQRLLELGAPSVALCPVVESDWRGYEGRLEEAYEELADWFISEARQERWPPLEVEWSLLRAYHRNRFRGQRPSRPCPIGDELLAVDPDGAVMPCHRFLYRPKEWLGTVDDTTLPVERNKYLTLSSRDILGCDDCVARTTCGGGCRVIATSAGLDLKTGAYPGHCLIARAQARAIQRIYHTMMEECKDAFLFALYLHHQRAEPFGELAT